MIFLSHNHKDKVIVEQIAIRLRDIFGEDKVFYDSWSMQPGDGIIDKMNEGLSECKLFLFFVSKSALQSNMVKLEWQNAVFKATKGETKIVPVKLDGCLMPAVLLQSLYIDLYSNGLEIALRQIVDVVSGRNTFQEGLQEFSNLKAYMYKLEKRIIIECHAEYYLEPISSFLFLVLNDKEELTFKCISSAMVMRSFVENIKLDNGSIYNGQKMSIEKATVPGFPFVIDIKSNSEKKINFVGVLHEIKRGQWRNIPLVHGEK